MSYYFTQGKLNDHIVYDFENFSEINVKVHDDSTKALRDKSVDEIVEILNKMDKHIVNLKRVHIQKNDPKYPRLDSWCIERYDDGWKINTHMCEIWYNK